MNSSYDKWHFQTNDSQLIRGIIGVWPIDYLLGKQYTFQQIYDHVTLLDNALLQEINDVS